MSKLLLAAACCLLFLPLLRAQDKLPVKFGKVTPEDFNVTISGPDSAAGAVVIADFGTSTFEANNPMDTWWMNFANSLVISLKSKASRSYSKRKEQHEEVILYPVAGTVQPDGALRPAGAEL